MVFEAVYLRLQGLCEVMAVFAHMVHAIQCIRCALPFYLEQTIGIFQPATKVYTGHLLDFEVVF